MDSTFEIFKILPGGPLWVAAVRGRSQAKDRMARFALVSPGEYFIRLREEVFEVKQSEEWAEVT
ncbi:MAG TPA: hypothetical protein VI216_11485 [Candidatus Acidoferrales bacterium]